MMQLELFAEPMRQQERSAIPGFAASFEWVERECQRVLRTIADEGITDLQARLNWADFITERVERFNEDIEDWMAGRPEKRRLSILNYRAADEPMTEEELRLPRSSGDEDE